MIGRTIAHYKITSAIGAGGMGEVYRATDTKLGRDVALKVLPADMARDAERLARFQREARAVAALNHPNIVTIFSVEETEGIHFLTMELVEGKSLDRLIPSGGLPAEKIIEIAQSLSGALAAAHDKGIIHRDLKPANVMVTDDGGVKVLDFGLAKETREASHGDATLTSASNTKAGVVMGTPAYMSPEQISGRTVDHRTDIFSLGVVLYEMATGKRPFEGQSSAELISSILRDTPSLVCDLRADLPSELGRIIQRCLEKSAADRFPSAQEIRYGLRGVTTGSVAVRLATATGERPQTQQDSGSTRAGELWVAVLAFKNTGGDPELEALAEGLTEDITTGLARFSCLHVIARNSTMTAGDRTMDLRAVGKDLGARYVMEGAVRKSGSNVRISTRVVDAVTGEHLWAENYDRDLKAASLFELQDDITAKIVSTVGDAYGVLPRAMAAVVRRKPMESATPYEAVLRQFGYYQLLTSEEHKSVRDCLERAVEKEPDYADAWASLALMYLEEFKHGFNVRPDPLGRAGEATRRALALDSVNQRGYYSLASTCFFQKDFEGFRQAADRLLSLNPLDGSTRAWMGLMTAYSGDWDRGLALAARARALNPNHPGWYRFAEFWGHYRKQEYQEALEVARTINMPSYFYYHVAVAGACGQLGRMDEAGKALRELLKIKPDFLLTAREELGKWHQPVFVEHFIEGLRKAGLEIPEPGAAPKADSPALAGPLSSGHSSPSSSGSGELRSAGGFWVAVLPFKYSGGDASLRSLADGLSEEIVTGLSRFTYLRVIARGSTSRYASESVDVRIAGKELGARYVMEGSLRQAGTKLRISVQLVDATSGAHLWAETYDRTFSPEAVFELQDDLVPRIVSTVADWYGVLPHSMSEAVRTKGSEQLSPYEAVLRSFGYYERVTAEEHAAARSALERAVQQTPGNADGWAMLSMMYGEEFRFKFNLQPEPLGRSLRAAERAVDAGPSNHSAYLALAQALFFRKELDAFRSAAERSLALNPMDGATGEYLGHLLAFSGDWEYGCTVAARARELNPHHPVWYWALPMLDAFRKGDYHGARTFALKVDRQPLWLTKVIISALNGQLGERGAARKSVDELLMMVPESAIIVREELSKWYPAELVESLLEGLHKAGLEIPEPGAAPKKDSQPSAGTSREADGVSVAPPTSQVGADSGAARAGEGFWVAVLPFKYSGDAAILKALAEGLTEEIVTGLSRFSYLRVIARSSTSHYANKSVDVRATGKELGARYVMEGSLRLAGSKLRIAVQLVDASTGANLWAETFDRTFSPEAVFELQDELVPRIVSTVADTQGVLPRTMGEAVRMRDCGQLSPYEAMLLSFVYMQRANAGEHAAARAGLERALQQAPGNTDCLAMLSILEKEAYAHGFNVRPDSLARAFAAAQRAIEAAPSNNLAYHALAAALFFRREFQAFRSAAERAIALNPMDGFTAAYMGMLLAFAGDWEHGCALAERGLQLNPHSPRWYRFPSFFDAYRKSDYPKALEIALKINMPDFWRTNLALTVAYAQLGELEAARKAVRELLGLKPNFAAEAHAELGKWWDPELVEQLMDGLRKAGLEIGAKEGTGAAPDAF